MKKNLLSSFDVGNIRKALIFMAVSVALLTFSFLRKGINGDSLSTIAYLIGSGLFFYALLYPWGKAGNYFILAALFIILFTLTWFVGFEFAALLHIHNKWGNDAGYYSGFTGFAGVIGCLTGIFTFSKGWQRLPYAGAAFSLLAVFIMLMPCLSAPPTLKTSALVAECMLTSIQFVNAFALFRAGNIAKKESRRPKVTLMISTMLMLLMFLWAVFAIVTDSIGDSRDNFWKFNIGIWALFDLVIASITIYAYAQIKERNDT